MPTAKPEPGEHEAWAVVASYVGATSDLDADFSLSVLEGSGIPAVRIPPTGVVSWAMVGLTLTQPVRVLVPPDRADEAKELLASAEE